MTRKHSTQCWLKILQFMSWDGCLGYIHWLNCWVRHHSSKGGMQAPATLRSVLPGSGPHSCCVSQGCGGRRLVWGVSCYSTETLHISVCVCDRNLTHTHTLYIHWIVYTVRIHHNILYYIILSCCSIWHDIIISNHITSNIISQLHGCTYLSLGASNRYILLQNQYPACFFWTMRWIQEILSYQLGSWPVLLSS